MPWYGDPIILAGQPNTSQRSPEDLDSLAEDGQGIYRNTGAIWGNLLVDVTRRLSVETQAGGALFFDVLHHSRERFDAAVRLIGVKEGDRYKVYSKKSGDPLQDGYWTQWRFVSAFALECYYGQDQAVADAIPSAAEGLVERMAQTIEEEKSVLNAVHFDDFLRQRYKRFYEGIIRYGFGFLVENHYHGIYRLWSRMLFYSK
jgi:hypothetical protein